MFLLAEDKFMPEMHLRQLGFMYSAFGPFTKNKERIEKFKEGRYSRYAYQNELDKAYFQHDMASGDFKDLVKRTASDKVLRDKTFNTAKNRKYDACQRGLASIVYNFFDKKPTGGVVKNENVLNQEVAEELRKPIIKKPEKRKVH